MERISLRHASTGQLACFTRVSIYPSICAKAHHLYIKKQFIDNCCASIKFIAIFKIYNLFVKNYRTWEHPAFPVFCTTALCFTKSEDYLLELGWQQCYKT